MSKKKNGISIQANRDVTVGGDVVGGDKITSSDIDAGDLAELSKQFARIQNQIDERTDDPQVDKTEIKNLVENIEKEVKKGDEANRSKVERWLRFLGEMADDIFQVTTATLANPIAGVARTIQLIAQKAKEQTSSNSSLQ